MPQLSSETVFCLIKKKEKDAERDNSGRKGRENKRRIERERKERRERERIGNG